MPLLEPLHHIAVVCGGTSAEREVSLRTGAAVATALEQRGFAVTTVDLHDESIEPIVAARPDAVFLALHGAYGEDGRIQAALHATGLPYTGSGPLASRLAMDKELSKAVFMSHGIPTPAFAMFDATRASVTLPCFARRHGYPVVVKPAFEGSSLGVTVADTAEQALAGAWKALRFGERAMVETFVAGRELCATVCDGEAWPLIEVRPNGRFYDYAAKYDADSGTQYIMRPPIGEPATEACQRMAQAAYHALGCRGLARVDVLLSPHSGPHVLEVNTIPGMTPTSLAPKAAEAAGLAFAPLCEHLVRLAVLAAKRRAA